MYNVMLISLFARRALAWCLAVAAPAAVLGQTNYITNGVEYAIAGSLLQDQVHSQISLKSSGGFLVWQDNITDGNGLGISALQLSVRPYYLLQSVNLPAGWDTNEIVGISLAFKVARKTR